MKLLLLLLLLLCLYVFIRLFDVLDMYAVLIFLPFSHYQRKVRASDILSKFVGQSESALRSIFATARASAPCVLFLDEIDAIAGGQARGGGNQTNERKKEGKRERERERKREREREEEGKRLLSLICK